MYDVVVIGGGVIGATILRELTKYQLKVCLLEKESDVAMGASKANSGIVHAGFDAKPNSNKAKFNVLGSNMMEDYCKELGVEYKRNGALVVALKDEDVKALDVLKERADLNGVKDCEIIGFEELKKLEPNLTDNAIKALYAKTSGIVCPYGLTIASCGNAMDNGASLMLNFEVSAISKENGGYKITSSSGEHVNAKIIINCAGFGSQKIANMVGDTSFTIGARKGEYILLDRESGDYVSKTIFFAPDKNGKGVLVSPTVHGNVIVGPTAEVIGEYSTKTTAEGLNFIKEKEAQMMKNVPYFNTITSFTGVRAFCDRNDFVIEKSETAENFINVAGIESPGLTSAPAIAKYVTEELVSAFIPLKANENFNGKREPSNFKELSLEEKNEIIKKDYRYGNIVCRCEQITEGEIVRAITENPKATTIDAVKRRTRAGMGRCQGGFCSLRVAEILARELNVDFTKVSKNGEGSEMAICKTK